MVGALEHKEDPVANGGWLAGGGDQRRTQNKKIEGRVWMIPPKISAHAEWQDNRIYKSNTPEFLTGDKNRTKEKGQLKRGREEAARARDIM